MSNEITYQEYEDALQIVDAYTRQVEKEVNKLKEHFEQIKKERKVSTTPIQKTENHLDNKLDKTKHLTIHHLETRTLNGLYEYYLTNNLLDKDGNMLIENLKYVSKSKFSKLRNYGKKTLTELEDFAENRNIKLL
jgi:DNA-directed RNA polymerase alpha subunit